MPSGMHFSSLMLFFHQIRVYHIGSLSLQTERNGKRPHPLSFTRLSCIHVLHLTLPYRYAHFADMGKISQVRKQFVKTSNTQIVSEFGSRIVHISLVDVDNVPILAVVGTELRPRQMSYAVTEEFIKHLGLDKSQYTEKRWTSKNEVYGWLKNFLLNPSSDYCMQSKVLFIYILMLVIKGCLLL